MKLHGFSYLLAALNIRPFKRPATKWILVTIAQHRNSKSGQCYPSVELLMKLTGFSKRTILEATADLRECGVLSWVRGYGHGICNRYTLNLEAMETLAVRGAPTAPQNLDSSGVFNNTSGASIAWQKDDVVHSTTNIGAPTTPRTVLNSDEKQNNGRTAEPTETNVNQDIIHTPRPSLYTSGGRVPQSPNPDIQDSAIGDNGDRSEVGMREAQRKRLANVTGPVYQCVWCEGLGLDSDFSTTAGGFIHGCNEFKEEPPSRPFGRRLGKMQDGRWVPVYVSGKVNRADAVIA
jgi:hypothetical protein